MLQDVQVGHKKVEDELSAGIQVVVDTAKGLNLVIDVDEMGENTEWSYDEVECPVQLQRPCVLQENAMVMALIQLGSQLPQHRGADVDAVDIGSLANGIEKESPRADADFQDRPFGLEDFPEEEIVVYRPQMRIDDIVEAGYVFWIWILSLTLFDIPCLIFAIHRNRSLYSPNTFNVLHSLFLVPYSLSPPLWKKVIALRDWCT